MTIHFQKAAVIDQGRLFIRGKIIIISMLAGFHRWYKDRQLGVSARGKK